jgi:hypothetical protein
MNKFISVILVCTALVTSVVAEEPAPQRDFGYGSMEIYRINKATHGLKVSDIDDDGLDDIIFLNNTKSRIEILFRKKNVTPDGTELLEDSFENGGMMSDQMVSIYRLADFNNDKKPDILTMGSPLGIYIRYQKNGRKFSTPEHIFLNDIRSITTVQAGDINEDGRDDILVSRRKNAEILWNDKQHTFLKRKTILYSDDKCFWVELVDANADGHLDLLQYYHNKEVPLKLRLGDGTGHFGPSHMLRAASIKSSTVVRPANGNPLMFAGVMGNALGMRLYEFENSKQPQLLKTQDFTPQRLAIPGKGSVSSRPWLVTDFNADGYDDLLIAAPAKNRIFLYNGNPGGLDSDSGQYDSLAEVDGMFLLADNDVLAVSHKEKSVGIHRHKDMSKFPDLLELKGEMLAAGAVTGTKSIFVVRRKDDGMTLDCFNDLKFAKSLPLKLDNEPTTIRAYAMDKTTTGIILFTNYSPPDMFLLKEGSDKLEKVTTTQFRALSQSLKPSQIVAEVPGSGKSLVVAAGATVRRYAWSNATYRITRQFNPMNEYAKATLACPATLDKKHGLMVYDSNSKNLLWYDTENAGDPRKIHVTANSGIFEGIVQLKNKKRSVVLMISDSDIAMLADTAKVISLKQRGEYMSDAEKPSLRIVRVIQIGKKRPALALIDSSNRSIEIVTDQDSGIKNELTFAAYLKSDLVGPAAAHSTEPHDIAAGDINGDGLSDLVLLVHDKLIIYPAE